MLLEPFPGLEIVGCFFLLVVGSLRLDVFIVFLGLDKLRGIDEFLPSNDHLYRHCCNRSQDFLNSLITSCTSLSNAQRVSSKLVLILTWHLNTMFLQADTIAGFLLFRFISCNSHMPQELGGPVANKSWLLGTRLFFWRGPFFGEGKSYRKPSPERCVCWWLMIESAKKTVGLLFYRIIGLLLAFFRAPTKESIYLRRTTHSNAWFCMPAVLSPPIAKTMVLLKKRASTKTF